MNQSPTQQTQKEQLQWAINIINLYIKQQLNKMDNSQTLSNDNTVTTPVVEQPQIIATPIQDGIVYSQQTALEEPAIVAPTSVVETPVIESVPAIEQSVTEVSPVAVETVQAIDTPVIEAPVVEQTPIIEQPAVESAQVVETPVVEAPVVEQTPIIEQPAVEPAQVVETPVIEAPVVEQTPIIEQPAVEPVQVVETPVVEAPVVEQPITENSSVIEPAVVQASVLETPIIPDGTQVVDASVENISQPIVQEQGVEQSVNGGTTFDIPPIITPVEPVITNAGESEIPTISTEGESQAYVATSNQAEIQSPETVSPQIDNTPVVLPDGMDNSSPSVSPVISPQSFGM